MKLDDRSYWLWLQRGLGAGSKKLISVVERFDSPQNCWRVGKSQWSSVNGFTSQETERLAFYTPEDCQSLLQYAEALGQRVITPAQWTYPRPLRYLSNPPAALYVKGDFPFFEGRPWIAIVGSREASIEDCRATEKLAGDLAKQGAVIVSGGAAGIDEAAHKGALAAGKETVCVLACGMAYPYLIESADLRASIVEKGAVLSEYAPDVPPLPMHFSVRNRLISGLCDGVIVIGAGKKSGSLVTAKLALEQNRILMVGHFSKGPLAPGCEMLYREGAQLISSAEDVLSVCGVPGVKKIESSMPKSVPEKPIQKSMAPLHSAVSANVLPDSVSREGKELYTMLTAYAEPVQISDLAREQKKTVAQMLAAATELEIAGLIKSYSGGRYWYL